MTTIKRILKSMKKKRDSKFPESVKQYSVKIIRFLPHSTQSFTQGFLFYNGKLYESTGLDGRSSLQCIDARTGLVEKKLFVPDVFAEGLARWDNQLIQLTWRNRIAFIYNRTDKTFYLTGKLWPTIFEVDLVPKN